MTIGAADGLRRLEIVTAIAGVSLLGGVLAASMQRWDYQARQGRAFSRSAVVGSTARSLDATVLESPRDPALDPRVLGRMEIPRLGFRAVVRRGVDDATLALAVGHLDGTPPPGHGGNAVLAAHRDTFFRRLGKLRLDDEIRIVAARDVYDYRVVSLEVVAATDTHVLAPTPDEILTLVTCYPFDFIGSAPDRFIVKAARAVRPPVPAFSGE